MGDDNTEVPAPSRSSNPLSGMPMWAWLLLAALGGGGVSTGGGALFGGQASADLDKFETEHRAEHKALDEALTELTIQLVRLEILKPENSP